MQTMTPIRRVEAGVLDVAYFETGAADGVPVVLMHGFPYDIHAYADVAPLLAVAGCRVIVPFMRGYGETRFLRAETMRSGQQAAFGADLLALLDALQIGQAVLAGYDWGGRACCIVATLWPERCAGLVSLDSYNIQNIALSGQPIAPQNEMRLWYQYYFHTERGRAGLSQNRRELCKLLWQLWSPSWGFTDSYFDRSAAAWDNPDFVEVAMHSYRHRYKLVAGDPAYEPIERQLAAQPAIAVPSITFDGADDGVMPVGGSAHHKRHFTGPHQHHVVAGAGHNLPQEKPVVFAEAVLELIARQRSRP
jgi:pimeloyl-ACP methyl ester carboxylesterase